MSQTDTQGSETPEQGGETLDHAVPLPQPQTQTQTTGAPASFFKSEMGSMTLIGSAMLGCVLIVWGLQRRSKGKGTMPTDMEPFSRYAARPTPERVVAAAPQQVAVPQTSRTQTTPPARQAFAAESPRTAIEQAADLSEIATIRQDLRDVGRRVVDQIDARLASLESAIERADAATQRLERAMRMEASVPPPSRVAAAPAPFAPEFKADFKPSGSIEASPDRDAPTFERALGTMDAPRTARDQTREIIELAERGVSARDIAQQLGRPIGQVELIIALRGKGSPIRQ